MSTSDSNDIDIEENHDGKSTAMEQRHKNSVNCNHSIDLQSTKNICGLGAADQHN